MEITSSLENDAFILAIKCFIARRGNISSMISDNGSSFVGAQSELCKAFKEMDQMPVKEFLTNNRVDNLEEKNSSSSMGKTNMSVRSILTALLKTHAGSLNKK